MQDGAGSTFGNLVSAMAGSTPIGAAAGAGMGLIQLLSGMQKQKKADAALPTVPPIFYEYLQDIKRKQRNAEVGSAYTNALNDARKTLAYGNKAVMATGNPMAASFARRSAADAMNKLLGSVQQTRLAYEAPLQQTTSQIGTTKHNLDVNRWANLQANANDYKTQGQQTLLAGLLTNIPALGLGRTRADVPAAMPGATVPLPPFISTANTAPAGMLPQGSAPLLGARPNYVNMAAPEYEQQPVGGMQFVRDNLMPFLPKMGNNVIY